MHKLKGFTLLEVIVFIILIGIVAAAVPTVISLPQINGQTIADPYEYDQALNIAKSHMDVMIGARATGGFQADPVNLDTCLTNPQYCPNVDNYNVSVCNSSDPGGNCFSNDPICSNPDFVCYSVKVSKNNTTASVTLQGLEAKY